MGGVKPEDTLTLYLSDPWALRTPASHHIEVGPSCTDSTERGLYPHRRPRATYSEGPNHAAWQPLNLYTGTASPTALPRFTYWSGTFPGPKYFAYTQPFRDATTHPFSIV